jgi:hypothetical protein
MKSDINFQEKLNDLLRRRGLNFTSPSPKYVWEIFKEWTRGAPVHWWDIDSVGFRVWDKDKVIWLQFTNTVSDGMYEKYAPNAVWAEVKCLLSCKMPPKLNGVFRLIEWCSTFDVDLTTSQVEGSEEFKRCMALGGWRWVS